MKAIVVFTTAAQLTVGGVLFAQTPAPRSPARPPVAAPAPAEPAEPGKPSAPVPEPPQLAAIGQPVNIKVEVTISDQRSNQPPIKKTVVAVLGDRLRGSVRSQALLEAPGQPPFTVPVNLDATPVLLPDGKIRVSITLQYDSPGPNPPPEDRQPGQPRIRQGSVNESLTMILESGKSLVVSQSADAVIDRQVSVEVKATILK